MSESLFPTVSAMNYPAFQRLLPNDAGANFGEWVNSVYTKMIENLSGRHGAEALVVEVDPAKLERYLRERGIHLPGLTELNAYGWTLPGHVRTDPLDFIRKYAP